MDHTEEKSSYRPLLAVIGIALLAAASIQAGTGAFEAMSFMNRIMGMFFLLLAMFKFFDLRGFAQGFRMYDIAAKKFQPYAYAYPFIELVLGALYLSGQFLYFAAIATVLVMAISAAGVFISMKRGYKFKCACLGTVLNVPLSTVSLTENIGMGLMAVYMLVQMT
ncbi:MAG: hypothetical protein JWM96_312 [Alphaproteobacteria bacterium]|nr:hypothetical protein [Alphaproteobacteria bacterium]